MLLDKGSVVVAIRSSLRPTAFIAAVSLLIICFQYLIAPSNVVEYPFLICGPIVFLIVQVAFPSTRFTSYPQLSPGNWAWLLFAVQLVLIPELIFAFGPKLGQMQYLPTPFEIQIGFFIQILAYIAFSLGFGWVVRRPMLKSQRESTFDSINVVLAVFLILIGLVGLLLHFHTLHALFNYFTGHFYYQGSATPTSFLMALATFLTPCGAYGFIILWSKAIHRPRQRIPRSFLCLVGVTAFLGSYSYNRATLVIPIVALVGAYSLRVRPLSAVQISLSALVLIFGSYALGNFRTIENGTKGGSISLQDAGLTSGSLKRYADPTNLIETYGEGPQFAGLVVDATNAHGFIGTLPFVSDFLSPIPHVGKSFRAQSETTLYNEAVYRSSVSVDQIISLPNELYWSFGLPSVFLGMLAIGSAVGAIQRRLLTTAGVMSAYVYEYFGIVIAMMIIESIGIGSQILLYLFTPLLILSILSRRSPSIGTGHWQLLDH